MNERVVGSGRQERGAACTAWLPADVEAFGAVWGEDNITADEAEAMDDNAKLTWMRNNLYDPTGDSCR